MDGPDNTDNTAIAICRKGNVRPVSPAQAKPLIRSRARDNRSLVHSFLSFLGSQGYSESTRRAYGRVAADFVDFLHSTTLLEVDRLITREYLKYLRARGCSQSTVAGAVFALKCLFRFLNLADLLPTNPLILLRNPKRARKLPKYLTEQEMERFLAAAETPCECAVTETLYALGVRAGELCGIRLDDVNFEDGTIGTIRIRHGKFNKERNVFFGRPAAKAIHRYLQGRTTGFLFIADSFPPQQGNVVWVQRDQRWIAHWQEKTADANGKTRWLYKNKTIGTRAQFPTRELAFKRFQKLVKVPNNYQPDPEKPLIPRQIYNIVNCIAHRAGLGRLNPHALRHSFATHLLNRGVDLRFLQELLGHADIHGIQIYTHIATADLERTLAKCHPRWEKGKHGE